ncbi:MAG: type II toxin-antitoxin system Phd/YefM family antitoxin [Planctomycetota bacterium]
MTQVTIHEAKTHLSRLIAKVLEGEEVVIANRDRPVVRLEPIKPERPARKMGTLKGYFSAELLALLTERPELDEEIAAEFEGSD